jgi:hypothetical protein
VVANLQLHCPWIKRVQTLEDTKYLFNETDRKRFLTELG